MVFGALYFVFSIPFVLMMALIIPESNGSSPFSSIFLILALIIYADLGFAFIALGALV